MICQWKSPSIDGGAFQGLSSILSQEANGFGNSDIGHVRQAAGVDGSEGLKGLSSTATSDQSVAANRSSLSGVVRHCPVLSTVRVCP